MKRTFSLLLVAVVCLSLNTARARADEFATISAGDPIYSNLAIIEKLVGRTPAQPTDTGHSLTRYEAALETARAYFHFSAAEGSPGMTREGCKALRALVTALRPELRELNVDTDAALALAEGGLRSNASSLSAHDPLAGELLSLSRATSSAQTLNPRIDAFPLGSLLGRDASTTPSGFLASTAMVPLSQRLRVDTTLLALQREQQDPFGDRASGSTFTSDTGSDMGAGATISYDLNQHFTLRATSEARKLYAADRTGPSTFAAPLFEGATAASTSGAGLSYQFRGINFSTGLSRLYTDTGASGTRSGVGVGFSAWQNRLSLSADLSRLQPDDSALLASTNTDLHLGLDVTQRLSLGLLYQGLFTDQTQTSASRVAGAINLSF